MTGLLICNSSNHQEAQLEELLLTTRMSWPLKVVAALYIITVAFALDYYELLGVPRNANDREIKKAYRALSRQFHPDKNPGDEEAHQKFIEIANAYEVLSNPEDRAKYDRYGEEGVKGHPHKDPFDLFANLFNFGGSGSFFHSQGQRRGADTRTLVQIPLSDSFQGKVTEFSIEMQGICPDCEGTGSEDGKRVMCQHCRGKGQLLMRHQLAPGFVQQVTVPCDQCEGEGEKVETPCTGCKGTRVVREKRTYNLHIKPGAPRRWKQIFEGEGDQDPRFVPGNLIVEAYESPQNTLGYRRRGPNLFRTEILSWNQANSPDWKRELKRLDLNSTFIVEPTQRPIIDGQIQVVKGEGMPVMNSKSRGDLFVRYIVVPKVPPGQKDEL